LAPAAGLETASEIAPDPENLAGFVIGDPIESPRPEPVSRPTPRTFVTEHGAESEPSDAELERGILDALRLGLADVAQTLSARLDARHDKFSGIVDLTAERARRGRGGS
jgi:hypothetical protein